MRIRPLLTMIILSVCIELNAQQLKDSLVTIPRITEPITLDGLSNEAAWNGVKPFNYFVLQPVYNAPPSEKTELLVCHNDKYLFVAGRCYYADPGKIVARNFLRDGWRGDDWVTFHIDANNDKQNAVAFSIYPLGSRLDIGISNDAVVLGNSTFNGNYNLIWEGKSQITAEGWFFELKIPFSALRFKAGKEETVMSISSTRMIFYKNELHHFPRIPQNAVEGIMKPSLKKPVRLNVSQPSKLLYITPSLVGGIDRSYTLDASQGKYRQENDRKLQPSLDIKYGISPRLILDITANTDFAQAEADVQQFNLSRFNLFFPEQRFFFQEQAGLFEFNLGGSAQLFYSRNIGLKQGLVVPIAGGARLTGQVGKLDIGLLNIQTKRLRANDSTLFNGENFSIARLRKKVFNNNSYIGMMMTNNISKNSRNFTAGTDAVIRVRGQHYLLSSFAFSYPENGAANLTSARFNLLWDLRRRDNWYYSFSYTYSGRNFEPGLGFVDRSNFHNLFGTLLYGKFTNDAAKKFRYKRIQFYKDTYLNATDGKLETLYTFAEISGYTFKNHGLALRLTYNQEYLQDTLAFSEVLKVPGGRYHFANINASYEAPVNLRLQFPVTFSTGQFYDGWRTSFTFEPTWNINKYFELLGGYTIQHIEFDDRKLRSTVHLARLRFNWALNLHLSGTLQMQYNSVLDKFLANGRLRYNFRDGHDLYFVFNETFYQDRHGIPRLPPFEQQQMLLKYIYTFYR